MQILHKGKIREELDNLKYYYKKKIFFLIFLNSKIKKKGINTIKPKSILPAEKEKGPI